MYLDESDTFHYKGRFRLLTQRPYEGKKIKKNIVKGKKKKKKEEERISNLILVYMSSEITKSLKI